MGQFMRSSNWFDLDNISTIATVPEGAMKAGLSRLPVAFGQASPLLNHLNMQ
jgi:hypothetical protein